MDAVLLALAVVQVTADEAAVRVLDLCLLGFGEGLLFGAAVAVAVRALEVF